MILFGPSAVSKEISRGPLHSVGGSGLVGHCGKGVLVIDIEFFAGCMVVDVERQVQCLCMNHVSIIAAAPDPGINFPRVVDA